MLDLLSAPQLLKVKPLPGIEILSLDFGEEKRGELLVTECIDSGG